MPSFRIARMAEAGTVPATVTRRDFFGHDALLTLRLDEEGLHQQRVGEAPGLQDGFQFPLHGQDMGGGHHAQHSRWFWM